MFLAKLTEKRMLGAEEVAALVEELDHQYCMASWDARNTSATFKKSVARVSVSDHRAARSPLTQEVRPEDVADIEEKDWNAMGDHDYDGDYVASTDPIHPVNTDYSHPLDDDDRSWILNHFSPEEMEAPAALPDFNQSAWSWKNDDSEELTFIAASQQEHTTSNADDEDLVAWEPEAEASSLLADISVSGLRTDGLGIKEKLAKERIELVMEAFWTVVNEPTDTDAQLDRPSKDVCILLHNLDIDPAISTLPSTPLTHITSSS